MQFLIIEQFNSTRVKIYCEEEQRAIFFVIMLGEKNPMILHHAISIS
jgi:hypothetical protein